MLSIAFPGVQRREDVDTPEEAVQTNTDENYDTEYDVTDYDEEAAYDEYESRFCLKLTSLCLVFSKVVWSLIYDYMLIIDKISLML